MTTAVLFVTGPSPESFDAAVKAVCVKHPNLLIQSTGASMDSFMQVHGSVVLSDEPPDDPNLHQCES